MAGEHGPDGGISLGESAHYVLVVAGLSAFVNPDIKIPCQLKDYFPMATTSGRAIEFVKTFYIYTSWIPSVVYLVALKYPFDEVYHSWVFFVVFLMSLTF